MVNFAEGWDPAPLKSLVASEASIPGRLALTSLRGVSMCTIYVFHLDVI